MGDEATRVFGTGRKREGRKRGAEPAQTTPAPRPRTPGTHEGKRALSRCKGGPKRALLVVKGRIHWCKGRVRLERAT